MKEYLQKNYKKIIPYVIAACIVVSVIVSGIMAIIDIQKTNLKTYHVQDQYMAQLAVEDIYDPAAFVHDFLCVSNQMEALQVEGVITPETSGIVGYTILDDTGRLIKEERMDIQLQQHPEYGGVWIDVSDAGLVQGERYQLKMDYSDTEYMQVIVAGSSISVRQFYMYEYANIYTAGIIILMVAAVFWLYLMYKNGPTPKLYFVTSFVVGILLVFIMPPASQDDEYRHFIRAYQDAAGLEVVVEIPTGEESGLIGTQPTGEHMVDVPFEIDELRNLGYEDNFNGFGYIAEQNHTLCMERLVALLKADDVDSKHRVAITGVIFKDNTSYWPMIVGIKLADTLGVSELLFFHAARFGQLLVCLMMELVAMKLAPKMKEMIWLFAFIPNAFLLKASCNPDGLLTSEILLLAAIVIWMKEKKLDILSPKAICGWIVYLVLTYSILKMKLPYILISVGFLGYLGKDNIKREWEWIKSHKKLTIGIVAGVLVVGIAGVIVLKDVLLGALYQFLPLNYIIYIVEHPFEILKLFAGKWIEMWMSLYLGMKGTNLFPYPILVFGILIMLKKEQPVIKRVWFAFLFAVLVLVIVLVGYTLTPPDYGTIWGIGYRYILPFMIVGGVCLPAGNDKTQKIAVDIMPLAIFVTMTSTILTYFVRWSV